MIYLYFKIICLTFVLRIDLKNGRVEGSRSVFRLVWWLRRDIQVRF